MMSSTKEILNELQQFYTDIQKYRDMIIEPHLDGESLQLKRSELREKLVRRSGALLSIVVSITGEKYIIVKESGMQFDIWRDSLSTSYPSHRFIVINALIDSVNRAIGKIEKRGSYKPTKYELTSPLYWFERLTRWAPIAITIHAIKTHRLASIIMGFVILIAAILQIIWYVLHL